MYFFGQQVNPDPLRQILRSLRYRHIIFRFQIFIGLNSWTISLRVMVDFLQGMCGANIQAQFERLLLQIPRQLKVF